MLLFQLSTNQNYFLYRWKESGIRNIWFLKKLKRTILDSDKEVLWLWMPSANNNPSKFSKNCISVNKTDFARNEWTFKQEWETKATTTLIAKAHWVFHYKHCNLDHNRGRIINQEVVLERTPETDETSNSKLWKHTSWAGRINKTITLKEQLNSNLWEE